MEVDVESDEREIDSRLTCRFCLRQIKDAQESAEITLEVELWFFDLTAIEARI